MFCSWTNISVKGFDSCFAKDLPLIARDIETLLDFRLMRSSTRLTLKHLRREGVKRTSDISQKWQRSNFRRKSLSTELRKVVHRLRCWIQTEINRNTFPSWLKKKFEPMHRVISSLSVSILCNEWINIFFPVTIGDFDDLDRWLNWCESVGWCVCAMM